MLHSEPKTAYEKTIMSQATINIGTIGHVAHGKSTIVRSISGIHTIKFKSEKERNITIKLGYANAKIYKCDRCPRPDCYSSLRSDSPFSISCPVRECEGHAKLVKHVSFVDCPGHDVLMATMLSGTAIMNAALLLIASNEPCPQPQTQEHLFAVEIMNINQFVIVQNKIDLVSREQALEQKSQIDNFISNTKACGSPIVPAAGQFNVNISCILDFIVHNFKETETTNKTVKMVVIRSFDVNKPGKKIDQIAGGVIGGSLVSGELKINDQIEIRPGIITRTTEKVECRPFFTSITSLYAEKNALEVAKPGGLIGIGTLLDPYFCRADKLVGQVLGKKGELPDIFVEVDVEYFFFSKISGVDKKISEEDEFLIKGENILVNVGSTTSGATILKIDEKNMHLTLVKPACCEAGERISISKKIHGHWRLIGYGKVYDGITVEPIYD